MICPEHRLAMCRTLLALDRLPHGPAGMHQTKASEYPPEVSVLAPIVELPSNLPAMQRLPAPSTAQSRLRVFDKSTNSSPLDLEFKARSFRAKPRDNFVDLRRLVVGGVQIHVKLLNKLVQLGKQGSVIRSCVAHRKDHDSLCIAAGE